MFHFFFHLLQLIAFKNDEKTFFFILKALFVLKIFKFLPSFLDYVEKKAWLKKIRLISKFITSQPGWQRITLHVLMNLSWIKGNQTMKFGQFIECKKRNIFIQKSCRKSSKEASSRTFLLFQKALCEVKASGLQLSIYFDSPQLGMQ